MKSKIIKTSIATAVALALALPAFAQVGLNASASATINTNVNAPGVRARATGQASTSAEMREERQAQNEQNRMQKGEDRGDKAIQARIDALNKLIGRINNMKNLMADQKASFTAEIQASVTDMNSLLAKIQADTSTTTLKTDLQSIAPDYRIYMLVMPQLSLLSAVDRVNTLVSLLQSIQTKIQTRVSADASLSGNTTITSGLADMTAKLSDATNQSAAAQTEISGLKPDNGDKTVQASNTAALKDARTKIQAAQKDLVAARKDAGTIVKLIGGHAKVNASTTTTATASTSTQ